MHKAHNPSETDPSDTVQAEVARLLTTPGLLHEDQGIGLLCDSDQILKLRYFRGFITKIMHNGIRKFIPKTMKALNILGVELEFYGAISPEYQRLRSQGPIPTETHLQWYEAALDNWLKEAAAVKGGDLIQDILAHELVQHGARQVIGGTTMTNCEQDAVTFGAEVVLRRYRHDLPAALHELEKGTLDPTNTALEIPMNLAYWLKSDGAHVLTVVDALTARALSLVDGKRTLTDIAACFADHGLKKVDKEMLSNVFAQVARTHLRMRQSS